MFPEEEWKTQDTKFKSMPFTKSQARKFNRLYFSGAQEVIFDKQGRVLIPRYLKDFAGIKRDVMIIGVSNRIEIWDIEKWREFYNSERASFERIAEDLMTE
jgi:MraZ protein